MQSTDQNLLACIAFAPQSPDAARPPVIRNYALSVPAFDFLKWYQRDTQQELGAPVTNGQALERLLAEFAHLRFLTVDNPEWDHTEAYDAAHAAHLKAGKLKAVC